MDWWAATVCGTFQLIFYDFFDTLSQNFGFFSLRKKYAENEVSVCLENCLGNASSGNIEKCLENACSGPLENFFVCETDIFWFQFQFNSLNEKISKETDSLLKFKWRQMINETLNRGIPEQTTSVHFHSKIRIELNHLRSNKGFELKFHMSMSITL